MPGQEPLLARLLAVEKIPQQRTILGAVDPPSQTFPCQPPEVSADHGPGDGRGLLGAIDRCAPSPYEIARTEIKERERLAVRDADLRIERRPAFIVPGDTLHYFGTEAGKQRRAESSSDVARQSSVI